MEDLRWLWVMVETLLKLAPAYESCPCIVKSDFEYKDMLQKKLDGRSCQFVKVCHAKASKIEHSTGRFTAQRLVALADVMRLWSLAI